MTIPGPVVAAVGAAATADPRNGCHPTRYTVGGGPVFTAGPPMYPGLRSSGDRAPLS